MPERDIPLCVDLDGTLLLVDTFHEACVQLLKRNPLALLLLPFWAMRGRAYAKDQLERRLLQQTDTLPVHADFAAFLQAEHARGRTLVLVTAAHRSIAEKVARRVGIFEDVLASDAATNLKGKRKAEALVERYGEGNFDYAGNAHADLPVWRRARRAIVVHPAAGLLPRVRHIAEIERIFPRRRAAWRALLHAIRPHQLVKNLLIVTPLMSSHSFTDAAMLRIFAVAYISFSACTSATYILNDILDAESDRLHPHKRHRPVAGGHLSIPVAFAATITLLILGVAIAYQLPPLFRFVLGAYLVATTLYSWKLKQVPIADVLMLSMLYTLRIVAGNAASGISFSFWLLSFSMFFFYSLAHLKRYAELLLLAEEKRDHAPGRGYTLRDAPLIQALGVGSGLVSILVLGLYVDSQRVTLLYRWPHVLWLECVIVLYWISRMWFLAERRKLHDDPILFTVKDRVSYFLGLCVAIVAAIAT